MCLALSCDAYFRFKLINMPANISSEMYWDHGYEAIPKCQEIGADFIDTLAAALGFVIAIINLVVVIIIACDKTLHTVTHICMCNLAIADLLTGLLMIWYFGFQKVRSQILWLICVYSYCCNAFLSSCLRIKYQADRVVH